MAETKTVNLNVETNLGSLKSQLKEAQREVEALSEKFGVTSKEATTAARKAAELKDAIGDAKALTDAFNPDAKFNALTNSLSGVASGFAAYQGALGLIGVDSKELEATLLKVQSAMALSQGLQGLGEAKDSFIQLKAVIGQTAIGQKLLTVAQIAGAAAMKALNFVMKQNPIFLIIGGITALVAAIKIFNATSDDQAEKQKRINKLNEEYRKEIEKQLEIDIKLRDSRKGGLDDQEREIKLLKAKGGTDKEVYEAERKLIDTQLEKLAYASGYRGFLLKDEVKKRKDLQNDKAILDAQYNKSEEEKTAKEKEENKKRIDANKARLNKIAEDKKAKDKEEQAEFEKRKQISIDNANALNEALAESDAARQKAKEEQAAADAKMRADGLEKIKEDARKQLEINKQLQEQKVQAVQNGLSTIGNLAELFAGKSRKQQKRAFDIQKAANIASATIDTYRAVSSAIASTPGGPIIKGFAGAAVLTAGLLNIKKIIATKFDSGGATGGGGGGSTPSSGSGGEGAGGNVIAPNFNIVGANGTNQLKQLQQAPVQAYVVSGEMSTQQSLDRNRLRNATL